MGIFLRKYFVICILGIMTILGMAGCTKMGDVSETNSQQALVTATPASILPEDAEVPQPMEDSQVTETPRFTAEFIAEEPVAGILTTEKLVSEEATAEESASEDSIDWFAAYNGEKLQRITAQSIESYSPALCSDIIFYRTEEGEAIDEILNKMIDAMIQPLTEPSEVRTFTITEYRLEEQTYEVYDENVPEVWIYIACKEHRIWRVSIGNIPLSNTRTYFFTTGKRIVSL